MNSPAEVQVADGEEDVYLWPNEEIRKRALDAIVKRAEATADARYKTAADRVFFELEAKIKTANENFVKQAAEVDAAYTRLDALIHKAENTVVGPPPPDPLISHPSSTEVVTVVALGDLEEKVRVIGKFFYKLETLFQQVEQKVNTSGLYDQQMKDRLAASLLAEVLRENLSDVRFKVIDILGRLSIYSE